MPLSYLVIIRLQEIIRTLGIKSGENDKHHLRKYSGQLSGCVLSYYMYM